MDGMHEITKEMVNFVTVPPAYAGEKGLEICPGRKAVTEFAIGDEWSPADPLEGAITVNIGDMLMQWSDDRLKSTFHRVRMPRPGEYQGPRYSIGFFNQANKSSVIQVPRRSMRQSAVWISF